MNKTIKLISFILITIFALCFTSTHTFANTNNLLSEIQLEENKKNNADSLNKIIDSNTGEINVNRDTSIVKLSRNILSILQLLAVIIGLIMLVITGIKFLIQDPNVKGKFHEIALNYIIGAFLVFGAAAILSFLQKIIVEVIAIM